MINSSVLDPARAGAAAPRSLLAAVAAVVLFAAHGIFGAGDAAAAAYLVHERTLGNGMQVIVKEDHRSPTVVSMVWYRAGSMDEVNGTTGVAHVLEHMMFKGTRQIAPGDFSRTIARAGGRDNAFTNRDYTAYYQQLQKSKLPLAFKLEADRMANLILSEEEFVKEIKVVMEERRMRTEDQPHSQVFEEFMATTFQAHPYRTPVIGWMDDLEHMTAEDARDWYRKWYAPNNATLVVVGDVVPAEVFKLAEENFGAIAARELPPRKPQDEPVQKGVRRVVVKAPAELPYVLMGYHVPTLRDVERDWEPYALSVLAAVLDGSDAARLDRDLVRGSRIAVSAGAGYDGINRGPGMFTLEATPAAGKSVAEAEAALRAQLVKIMEGGVTEDELERVKAQFIAGRVFQGDSIYAQAMQIGNLHMAGLAHDSLDTQLRKVREVTSEQVREVARKYFGDDNLTVAVLDPQPVNGRKTAGPKAAAR